MDSSVSPKDEIWFLARVPSHFKRSLRKTWRGIIKIYTFGARLYSICHIVLQRLPQRHYWIQSHGAPRLSGNVARRFKFTVKHFELYFCERRLRSEDRLWVSCWHSECEWRLTATSTRRLKLANMMARGALSCGEGSCSNNGKSENGVPICYWTVMGRRCTGVLISR